jgi:phage-related protein
MGAKKPSKAVPANPVYPLPKPVVWLANSLKDARALVLAGPQSMQRALEKLVFVQFDLRLTTTDCHPYPAPGGNTVKAIRTGQGSSNFRIVFAEKSGKIYVLRAFHKPNNKIDKSDITAIAAQWATYQRAP